MNGHIPIIIDKSTLQGLTRSEGKWLGQHFMVVIPPVFFSEVLADINKDREKKTSTGTGLGDARMLAGKIPSYSLTPNMEAMDIVQLELAGRIQPPDGRPVVDAQVRRLADGTVGAYIDSTPMQAVLDRWVKGDFDGLEHKFAKGWRSRAASIDLEKAVKDHSSSRLRDVRSLEDLCVLVDALMNKPNQNYANLIRWLEVLEVPSNVVKVVLRQWKDLRHPPTKQKYPYTYYLARLRVFFALGVIHQLIGTRKTNVIDVDYLSYLPFCRIFSSGDKLHRSLFPFFATSSQLFIPALELKQALAELSAHYAALTEEEKQGGSMSYAKYPPLHMNNAVTAAYDHISPSWREAATAPPEPPMSKAESKALFERLKRNLSALRE
jgi:hypothetical protein